MTKPEQYLIDLLAANEYNPAAPPPIEQVVFRIQFKTIGSLGDFILFSGRPKSGKTKYVSGAIAGSISRQEVFGMNIRLPDHKRKVAHFDTEQGKYSHYKMMQLIEQLSGAGLPAHFKSYRCRSVAPRNILALVETYLKYNADCGMIFLDGLLDTVESMNDEKHSSHIKRWLKAITETYNVLLAGVIHRGFSNDKSIGQIGSDGERAAQTVLLVEKNKETKQYILRGEYMRDDDEFEPIAIRYSPQLQMWEQTDYIAEMPETMPRANKRKPHEYNTQEHSTKVYQIFNSQSVHSYKNLIQQIVEVYGVGQQWAKECIPVLTREGLIFRIDEGYTNKQQITLKKVE